MATVDVVRDAPRAQEIPVDNAVVIPDSVKQAQARAEALHRAAYGEPAAVTEPEPVAVTEPEPAAVMPAKSAAVTPAEPEPEPQGQPPNWERRYHAMKGRFEQAQQTMTGMQDQLSQMGDALMAVQRQVQQPAPQTEQTPAFVTKEDEEAYGADLIGFAQRAARQAVAPELARLERENAELRQHTVRQTRDSMTTALDDGVPTWREVYADPRFKQWLNIPDLYSSTLRSQLLSAAVRAGDSRRVVAFYKGFLAEVAPTGNARPTPQPAPTPSPRVPALSLENIATPGRPRPAGGNDLPGSSDDKPVFTRAEVRGFYNDVRRGAYVGREAEKQRVEAALFAAGNDGRIR